MRRTQQAARNKIAAYRQAELVADVIKRAAGKALGAVRFIRRHRQHLPLAFEAIFSYRVEVRLMRCRVKDTDTELAVLYVGRLIHDAYLTRTLFDAVTTLETRRTALWSYRRHVDALRESADLVIADLGWPYNARHRGEGLEMPDWLETIVDLGGDWSDVVSRFRRSTRRNDLRVIRRSGYACELTNDRAAIEAFYDDMYVPFVRRRHDAGAVIDPRRHVLRMTAKGTLMQIRKDGHVVAGGVLCPAGDAMLFLWMGLPQASIDDRPERVISALYYFGMQHAHERGCRIADFMGTRAFLDDGALLFKRKWAPVVYDTFSPGSLLISPSSGSEAAAAFCERFPVIARSPIGLEAVFVTRAGPVDETAFAERRETLGYDGVDGITIIEIGDADETVDVPTPAQCRYRLIRTRLERFAGVYASRYAAEPL